MANIPQIMGILNCTPDSFYDGGGHGGTNECIEHALKMVEEGVDIIDVGGESTRPGAELVSIDEELKRVIPVIEGIRKKTSTSISIDTTKAKMAELAIEAGASLVNDVSGLTSDPLMIPLIKKSHLPVVIMHSRGNPQTMQSQTDYNDVVVDVISELKNRIEKAIRGGIEKKQIILDPGFGFAKNFEQNITLLKNLRKFKEMGYMLLVGLSRKSFIGKITDRISPADRLYGSLAGALIAVQQGADILRVHNVRATREMLKVWRAIYG